jgi:orotate phosphoribosyltransferase
MDSKKERLINILKAKSYHYRPEAPFKLVSGRESPYYINCKPTTYNAEGMFLIGEIIYEMVKDLQIQAIGGLTMGADPIAHAVSMVSLVKGRPINSFSVRKQQKEHGMIKLVDGDVQPGDRVVIVEDVVTTGSSTLQAIDAAQNFGLEIVEVITLVDREEGGKKAIEEKVPKVEAVITLSELQQNS